MEEEAVAAPSALTLSLAGVWSTALNPMTAATPLTPKHMLASMKVVWH
jgi:hypothetical protein